MTAAHSYVRVNRVLPHFWLAMLVAGGFFCVTAIAADAPLRPRSATTSRPAVVTLPDDSHPMLAAPRSSTSRILLALAVVLLAIFLLRWWGQKFFATSGTSRSNRAIQVISRSTIAPRQQLMLVQVGRRLVLIGNAGATMNTLCEISDATEVADLIGQVRAEKADSITGTFGSLFRKAEQRFESEPAEQPAVPEEQGPPETERESLIGARGDLAGLIEKVNLLSRRFPKA